MKRIVLVLIAAYVLSGAACTSTKPVSVAKGQLQSTARSIAGTSLIGARGATARDQDKIDDTVAGLCAARAFTPDECAAHDKAVNR
ncbi:hypothetical protein M0654_03785 [Rhizobium sp. NTR19]|uniref:Uncharacterized protein n=1 Tax=Neorhizobium turbinariae TaxID=2937795 RepID=A0ABT0IMK6_9HYPH|nr:hypothetical protein [Neorhizobium turbinariae]MCK8779101.1 hypothetical protein [Neorhizobium turbinariae]